MNQNVLHILSLTDAQLKTKRQYIKCFTYNDFCKYMCSLLPPRRLGFHLQVVCFSRITQKVGDRFLGNMAGV